MIYFMKQGSRMRMLALSTVFLSILNCSSHAGFEHLQRAEELSRQKKFDEAIAEYREHIETRLSVRDRPEWENPYFYLILIGDTQLGQGNIDAALQSFELAEQNKVDRLLVSDRYRYVASVYEKQGDLARALEILKKYRDRDPGFYDSIMDRIAKEMTLREDRL
jgi:tetratricopeptide (TPR) repeat protein